MKKDFGRIGVLYGGPSNEREISLISGESVGRALKGLGHDAVLIDAVEPVAERIRSAGIAVAFIALHGRFGEDGTIQKLLEEMGIPYTGSGVEASALAMDKVRTKEVFLEAGIPTPDFAVLRAAEVRGKKTGPDLKLELPVIVKPVSEGSSLGVTPVRRKEELLPALESAFAYGEDALVEDLIEGRELTAAVLGDPGGYRTLPLIEIVPRYEFFSYQAKYLHNGARHLIPPRLSESGQRRVEEISRRACEVLGCAGVARVDLMVSADEQPWVLEVNTIPGMTPASLVPDAARAAGMDLGGLCEQLLELACRRQPRLSTI